MKAAYNWLAARDGYAVTLVGAGVGAAVAFGAQLSAEQTVAIMTFASGLLAFVLGRPVKYPPEG